MQNYIQEISGEIVAATKVLLTWCLLGYRSLLSGLRSRFCTISKRWTLDTFPPPQKAIDDLIDELPDDLFSSQALVASGLPLFCEV